MSLRLNAEEADRIRGVCKHNQQTISDFVRTSVRRTLETEELRILELKSERARLEKSLSVD
jgi:Arc/MetJ-type ribon-helix-helix transcriptional regulator